MAVSMVTKQFLPQGFGPIRFVQMLLHVPAEVSQGQIAVVTHYHSKMHLWWRERGQILTREIDTLKLTSFFWCLEMYSILGDKYD